MTAKEGQTTAVQVALRIRPLTDRDRLQPRFANLANDDVLKIHDTTVQVVPHNKAFIFDHVFGTNSTQQEIFATVGDNLIRKFVDGYNITILAYGQTSSGKTYTMGTAANTNSSIDDGIVPRSMALLFDILQHNDARPISPTSSISSSTSASTKSASRLRPKSRIANRATHIPHTSNTSSSPKTKYTVKVSFIEIYNEDLHDLLNPASADESPTITIREDPKGRIYWTGVKEVVVNSTDDVLYHLEQGTQNRATGATDMNEQSSRSHAIFSVSLKQERWVPSALDFSKKRPQSSMSMRSPTPLPNKIAPTEDGEWIITSSKFNFVDLAGSERLKRTAAEGDRRKEGININAGLLALGNVISALGDPSKKKVHVPYRDSKLTRLLQDSLGGSATTLMIACASPAEYNLAETLNTLQYANRARNIKNKSEKNEVEEWMTTENTELLRTMIGKLKNELMFFKTHKTIKLTGDEEDSDEADHEQRLLIADLQRQVEELDGEASVTRERNRMVEKELQRMRAIEAMLQHKQEMESSLDFQHLVEPVIEEYEKSISKLESQLALSRAALNHSDMGFEEQQRRLTQLETTIKNQEQIIGDLRLRLGKILERESNSEGYIQELETKLLKSAQATVKDQEMLNELKNRIMKFKETDENTEQYILSLEQRLAAADIERTQLKTCIEELEKKLEAKEKTNIELLKKLVKASHSDKANEHVALKELEEINTKYSQMEKERDALQMELERMRSGKTTDLANAAATATHTKEEGAITAHGIDSPDSSRSSTPVKYNRRSLGDEKETKASTLALSVLQAETKARDEAERADRLQSTLDRLQQENLTTRKELDEVLHKYAETVEHLQLLERMPSASTSSKSNRGSVDLSQEIEKAKVESDKTEFMAEIQRLKHEIQECQINKDLQSKEIHDLRSKASLLEKYQNEALSQYKREKEERIEALKSELLESSQQLQTLKAVEEQRLAKDKEYRMKEKSQSEEDQLKRDLKEEESRKRLEELAIEKTSLTQSRLQLESQLDVSRQEVDGLKTKLAETLTALKLAHDGLQKQVDPELLIKKQQEIDVLNKDIDQQMNRVRALEYELEGLHSEYSHLEASSKREMDILRGDQDALNHEYQEIISNLEKNIIKKSQEMQNMIVEIEEKWEQDYETLSHDLNERISFLTSDNQHLQDELETKLIEVDSLREKVNRMQSESFSLQQEHDADEEEWNKKFVSLQQQYSAEKDSWDKKLTDLHQQYSQDGNSLSEQLIALQQQYSADNECLDKKLNALQQKYSADKESWNKKSFESQQQYTSEKENWNNQLIALQQQYTAEKESWSKQFSALKQQYAADKENWDKQSFVQSASLDRLKEQAAALEEEMSIVYSENDQLLKVNKEHKTANENAIHQIHALEEELTNVYTENDKLLLELHKLKEDFEFKEESWREEQRMLSASLDEQLNSLSSFRNDKEKEDSMQQHNLHLLQREHTDQKIMIQTLTDKLAQLVSSKDELVHRYEAQIADMTNAQKKLVQSNTLLNEQLAQMKSAADKLNTEHMQEIDIYQKEMNSLQSSMKKHQAEWNAEKNSLQSTIKKHQDEWIVERNSLQSAIKKYQDDMNTEKSLLTAERERKKAKETQWLESLQKDNDQKDRAIHVERLELEDYKKKVKSLETKMEEESTVFKKQISELELKLKKSKDENMEYSSLAEELEKEIHRMTQEIHGLAEELEANEDSLLKNEKQMSAIREFIGASPKKDKEDLLIQLKQWKDSLNKPVDTKTITALQSELKQIQLQLKESKELHQKELSSLESQYQSQIMKEKQTAQSIEKSKSILERQVDELLRKKKSFMCF